MKKNLLIIFFLLGLPGIIPGIWAQTNAAYFEMPPLPYAPGALEPYISTETMSFHYDKHVRNYLNNTNRLLQGNKLAGKDLETIVIQSEGELFNNAAQLWNHIFFFNSLSPDLHISPTGALAKAIEKQWGNFDNFKKNFTQASRKLFGSGWVWLVEKPDGTLDIISEQNAGNPLKAGLKPLFGSDLWEHAYYIDYRNDRNDYIEQLWNVIDWNAISERYEENQSNGSGQHSSQ